MVQLSWVQLPLPPRQISWRTLLGAFSIEAVWITLLDTGQLYGSSTNS